MKTAMNRVAMAAMLALVPVLYGCQTRPVTVQVKVPVPVECREPVPVRPVMPTELLVPGVAVWDLMRSALAEIDRRESYEVRLRAALVVCTTPIE